MIVMMMMIMIMMMTMIMIFSITVTLLQGLKFRAILSRIYFLDGQVVREHAGLCENRGSKLHVSCLISHDLGMENSRSFMSLL